MPAEIVSSEAAIAYIQSVFRDTSINTVVRDRIRKRIVERVEELVDQVLDHVNNRDALENFIEDNFIDLTS